MKISIDVATCKDCPFHEAKRHYTADSFEYAHDWLCKKAHGKKIAGYVEWHEEKKVEIPEWCPAKVPE